MTETRLTVREFAKCFNFNEEYVRRMIRGNVDPRTGRTATLPHWCRAQKIGRQYFLLVQIDERVTAQSTSAFENVPTMDEAARAIALRWSQPGLASLLGTQVPKPVLPDPERFMHILELCYLQAIEGEKDIKLSITFKPDGDWKTSVVPADDLDLSLRTLREPINEVLALEFTRTWFAQVSKKSMKISAPSSGGGSPEFFRRCLGCGTKLPKKIKPGERYHTVSNSRMDCKGTHTRRVYRWSKWGLAKALDAVVENVVKISGNF